MTEAAAIAGIVFDGPVRCLAGTGPLTLVLSGASGGEPLEAAFAAGAAPPLPAVLEQVRLRRAGPGRWRLEATAGQWTFAAALHLHRDLGGVFYRAIPPRPAPWRRRLAWRALLALASVPPVARRLARGRTPAA